MILLPVMAVGALLLATAASPVAVMLLGPLLLGVPHVASDLRYLLVQPAVPVQTRFLPWLYGLIAAMLLLRTALPSGPAVEIGVGLLVVVMGIALSPGHSSRRLASGLLWLVAAGLAWVDPAAFALALGHMHNLVALGAWWLLTTDRHAAALVIVAALGAAAFILGGGIDASITAPAVGGLSFTAATATLAPGWPPLWAGRIVLSYALLQGVHYVAWLWWIPSAVDAKAWDLAGWQAAFGRAWWLVVAAAIAVPVAAIAEPAGIRAMYLSVVLFHGWLEIAVLSHRLAGSDAPG